MVHTLVGLNPTLPHRIGRVGLATPIRGITIPQEAQSKILATTLGRSSRCGYSLPRRVFSSGAAAVARGRIRKSQRNQSFKRYATAVRRKDLKAGCNRPGDSPQERSCHKQALFPRKPTKIPDRAMEAARSGSVGTVAALRIELRERGAAAQGVEAAQSRPVT